MGAPPAPWVLPTTTLPGRIPPTPLLARVLFRCKVVLVGGLGVPALAGDPRHGDIHPAPVAFALAPEAASGEVEGPRAFLCLRGGSGSERQG